MTEIRVLVWKGSAAMGEPDFEVKVPSGLAKWVPRMMAFVPKKSKAELWGENADLGAMFANLEQLVKDAAESGLKEIMDVTTKESHVKVMIEG